jgi:multicomponent Na+:H+ antiporter subunit E
MKHFIALFFVLAIVWLIWSGHLDVFLLAMGLLSCLTVLFIAGRMGIVDKEGVPIQLGVRPQFTYLPWLAKEVLRSNWVLAKLIMSSNPKLHRNLIKIPVVTKTEIGRVILANSITLTPGTVATRIQPDTIEIHTLVDSGEDNPTLAEIGRRVRQLERE